MNELASKYEEEVLPAESVMLSLTQRQKRAIMRLSRLDDIPETQAELARAIGITERSLYEWWTQERWCVAVYELTRRTRIKHLPAIESSLVKRAKEGSYLHQKGFYRLIGIDLESPQGSAVQVNINLDDPG